MSSLLDKKPHSISAVRLGGIRYEEIPLYDAVLFVAGQRAQQLILYVAGQLPFTDSAYNCVSMNLFCSFEYA